MQFQTKPEIAVDLVKQVLADGVSPAPVLGDEVYGTSGELRRELRRLGLEYFLNAGSELQAWTEPVKTRLAGKRWVVVKGEPKSSSPGALSRTIAEV